MIVIALLILVLICIIALCDRSVRRDEFARTFISIVLVLAIVTSLVFIIIH